jgi:hypothetical protein
MATDASSSGALRCDERGGREQGARRNCNTCGLHASGIAHAHRLFSAFLDQPGNKRFNSVTIRHKRYASVLARL